MADILLYPGIVRPNDITLSASIAPDISVRQGRSSKNDLILILQAAPDIVGAISLSSLASTLASTGELVFEEAVAEASPASTIVAAGALEFDSAIAEASPASALSAAAQLVFQGAVAEASLASVLNGAGELVFEAAVALASPASAIAGGGEEVYSGAIGIASPSSQVAAAGDVDAPGLTFSGDIALASQPSEVAATAEVEAVAVPFPVYWGGGSGIAGGRVYADYGQKPPTVSGSVSVTSRSSVIAATAEVEELAPLLQFLGGGHRKPAGQRLEVTGSPHAPDWPTEEEKEEIAIALLLLG
jgi:hypothetical protein